MRSKWPIAIPTVFKELLEDVEVIRSSFNETQRDDQRIAVVISVFDEKDVLPSTLKEMVDLIMMANLDGEIFVILNNGGGNSVEFINRIVKNRKKLKNEIGIDEIILGKTCKLKGEWKNSNAIPRKIKLEKEIPPKTNRVTLVVINQDHELDNAGKIRGLRDIYEFLRIRNQESGYCPQYLLTIDAETRLRRRELVHGGVLTEPCFGLKHLVEHSNKGMMMVGAKNLSIPYDAEGNPNWKATTPPMQEVSSILHGLEGYQWLPGGATLGGFKDIVSIMCSISRKLPGSWVEDTMMTATAKAIGIEITIDQEVIHTNRCPSPEEDKKASDQIERWLMGTEGVRNVIGPSFAKTVINNKLTKAVIHLLSEFIKGRRVNFFYLLKGLIPYFNVRKRSRLKPNDIISDPAVFL